jgi:hypothetical protein
LKWRYIICTFHQTLGGSDKGHRRGSSCSICGKFEEYVQNLISKPEEKYDLGDVDTDERIILKWVIKFRG